MNAGVEKSAFLVDSMTQEELQECTTGVASPELFAVAMVIDPSIVLEKERVAVAIELRGELSRGMMIADRRGLLGRVPNASIVRNLDVSKTQALFGAIFQEISEPLSIPVVTVASAREHKFPILQYREVQLPVV